MDDSLEALLEKATNPRNRYEDWEFIMGFCDKVNADIEGPQVALRIVVPKIKSQNEKVAMLTLALLEACVKNCGQKFHQELGKFKFLNELIRLISPKYLGDTTPPLVKDRIKELLFGWKVGLAHEGKINEAFLMLKREGLIFDETVAPDRTLEPDQQKPKVSLAQDPKQSRMLQKLLSSKNPEDLRAANRLIREMVRRDDKRMQKLQKRIEEVELIQNNVKLLNELLLHLREDSADQERLLIQELYKSIDKMRPKIFRMASELKESEDGMSDILQTNDSVLRVMDLYASKMGGLPQSASNDGALSAASNSTIEPASKVATSDSAASSQGLPEAAASSDQNGTLDEATGSGSDVLIDLADLNFDPISGSDGVGKASGGVDFNSSLGLGSLMDDISALDLGTPTSSLQGMFPPPPGGGLGGGLGSGLGGGLGGGFASFGGPQSPFASIGFQSAPAPAPLGPGVPQLQGMGTTPLVTTSTVGSSSNSVLPQPLLGNAMPPSLITIPPPPQQQARGVLGQVGGLGSMGGGAFVSQQPVQATPPAVQATPPLLPPVGGTQQPPLNPLDVLDNMTLALDTIKPGSLSPMPVVNKNNVAITFYFAEASPAPGVSVVVISIISTSSLPVADFQFQAAVPKVMRVKLQPPTATELGAYNPILPPPSISQVMLLANPSKAKIRMKYRISYKQGGPAEIVELGEISDFPATL